jgi:hypothetical protein
LATVVQVTLQAPELIRASEELTRSRGPWPLHRVQVACGGQPRSQLAALRAKLFDLIGEFAVSALASEASTAQDPQRLDETVRSGPFRSSAPAGLVTLLTRFSDCGGLLAGISTDAPVY